MIRDEFGRKYCSGCELWHAIDAFGIDRTGSLDGLKRRCRAWTNANVKKYGYDNRVSASTARTVRLKTKYRLTVEQFDQKLNQQGHGCGCCGRPIDESTAQVDHDHSCCAGRRSCGECVRDLLCSACNGGLGLFKDDPERLELAIKYLTKYKEIMNTSGGISFMS